MRLLIDIPEVPQGSKTCGKCNKRAKDRLIRRFYCREFRKWTYKRLPACLAAESAALDLLRKAEAFDGINPYREDEEDGRKG